MKRSLVTNEQYPLRMWRNYYNSLLDNMTVLINGSWGKRAQDYRSLRLAIRQYLPIRQDVQNFHSLDELEAWLQKPFEVQACPFNILDKDRAGLNFYKAEIVSVMADDNISTTYGHNGYSEEEVNGPGFNLTINFYVRVGMKMMDSIALTQGLAAFGLYCQQVTYESFENSTFYHVRVVGLYRDFEINDFDAGKWISKTADYEGLNEDDDDFEDDELERLLREENERENWGF